MPYFSIIIPIYNRPDEVNSTAVLVLCIGSTFQMLLVSGHSCCTAKIQLLSAVSTVTDA